jgi:hypothetical protein
LGLKRKVSPHYDESYQFGSVKMGARVRESWALTRRLSQIQESHQQNNGFRGSARLLDLPLEDWSLSSIGGEVSRLVSSEPNRIK